MGVCLRQLTHGTNRGRRSEECLWGGREGGKYRRHFPDTSSEGIRVLEEEAGWQRKELDSSLPGADGGK